MFDKTKENAILLSTFQSKEDEMGLFDKIKGLVVETDDVPAPTTPPTTASAPQPVTQQAVYQQPVMSQPVAGMSSPAAMSVVSPTTNVNPSAVFSPNVGFNQEMYDKIMTVLEKNNMEGFDYFEFRQSILNANSMPLPEADKYRTIYSMAKPFGVTRDKLLTSIDFYIQKLDEHKQGFGNYIATLREQEIISREQKKTGNETLIQQKSDLIRQLNEEISALTQENTTLATEVYAQNAQITAKEQSFAATFDVVVKQLTDDKTKIDTYIQPNS
jgi:hypothetical protein